MYAEKLDDVTSVGSRLSYETRAAKLNAVKGAINAIGSDFRNLHEFRASALPWQESLMLRIEPGRVGLASHTPTAIDRLNEDRGKLESQEYRDAVGNMQTYAGHAPMLVTMNLDYAEVGERLNLLDGSALEPIVKLKQAPEAAAKVSSKAAKSLEGTRPLTFAEEKPMDVAPHPHIGLQTVTWLLDGEIQHDDSLGCEAVARTGGVNVMTAGAGISHAEQTPRDNSRRLDGVQLWVALPQSHRGVEPAFEALARVPRVEQPSGTIHVFAGSIAGLTSPARHYSEIVGGDVQINPGETLELGLDERHEHALLVLRGDCSMEGQPLSSSHLHYLGVCRPSVALRSHAGARVLLIGGRPFQEAVLMWWNFVARTPEEIAHAREDWEQHRRFGDVRAYRGPRLAAPDLIRFARPNLVS